VQALVATFRAFLKLSSARINYCEKFGQCAFNSQAILLLKARFHHGKNPDKLVSFKEPKKNILRF
jgi:hypothetical protein